MYRYANIYDVKARQILDSRGNPTVEAEVIIGNDYERFTGRASVPSGASTGKFEAVEIRDNNPDYYNGKSVYKAIENINSVIAPALIGKNAFNQISIDQCMLSLDDTDNKCQLGANAILAVSIATAKACAKHLRLPLFRYLGGVSAVQMPIPMMNIINGGAHSKNALDFQEFMIMPVSGSCFKENLRKGVEVYQALKEVLEQKGLSTAVGDEGGFAPEITNAEEAFILLMKAVEKANLVPGKDIQFAMDAAASELYQEDRGCYLFHGEGKKMRTTEAMIDYYQSLIRQFPLQSIEDGLAEEDWTGWQEMTRCLGRSVQLVGDDLFVTNTTRLSKGIREKCANAILIKPNQIGSLTETMNAIRLAKSSGYRTIISHRSGDTEDTSIADLSVALNCGQIKTGAPCRSERTAKYNRLLQIEELLV